MRFSAALGCWLVAATLAHADLVVVQKVEGGGQSGDQTIRVKGDQARCDVASAISLIVDGKSGETTTLSHAQKGFVTVTPERAAAMIERMKKARGSAEPPVLVATQKKEKIGDYPCEVFTSAAGDVKLTYWMAKDFPNFASLLAQMDVLESGPLSGTAGGLSPRSKDFPGMPMKIVMEKGGQKVTITLVSAKEEMVDPAIFKVPDGYKELPATAAPAKP